MERVEQGEQNLSIQKLIQIPITLKIEVAELMPAIKQLKKPL